jgi:hypothetical protein
MHKRRIRCGTTTPPALIQKNNRKHCRLLIPIQSCSQRTQNSLLWRAASVLEGIGVLECVATLEDDGAGTVHEAPSSRAVSQHHPPAKLMCLWPSPYMLITWLFKPSTFLPQRACELLFTSVKKVKLAPTF